MSTLTTSFSLNAHILTIMYICYKFKFPFSLMLTFYENYGDNALFVFKALACKKQIKLNDAMFIKIVEDSRKLCYQIFDGEIKKEELSADFQDFVDNFLFKYVDNIYEPLIRLNLTTLMLYEGLK